MAVFVGLFLAAMSLTTVSGCLSAVRIVLFMKLFRLFEIVAFAGDTKHTERQRNQEKFHRAPSITTARPKASKE